MLQAQNTTFTTASWQTEFKDSLRSHKDLEDFFETKFPNINYPSFIPRSFAKKIKTLGPNSSLAKQFLPQELESDQMGTADPIGDIFNAKNDGIIHRYKSRILFTPTTVCPILCRYCFRKNELTEKNDIFTHSLSKLKDYLLEHTEVNEVILSGGDPLILSNQKIEKILELLSQLNIKFVRFHTRTPIIIPSRIDSGFVNLLSRFENEFTRIVFVLHTNHCEEIDIEVAQSLEKLRSLNIERRTQSVLLKNVNNEPEVLTQLIYRILDIGFTPYYLHHPDKVLGGMHFYLPLAEGRKIYAELRDQIPGWAIPHYVIDGAFGKSLAFNPESLKYSGNMIDKNGQVRPY